MAEASAQEAAAALSAKRAEAEQAQHALREQLAREQEHSQELQAQLLRVNGDTQLRIAELSSEAERLQRTLQEERDRGSAAAARAAAAHEQQLQSLHTRLSAALTKAADEQAGVMHMADDLRSQLQDALAQLMTARAERDALQERVAAAVGEAVAVAEAASDEAQAQVHTLQLQIAELAAANAALHAALEELAAAASTHQVRCSTYVCDGCRQGVRLPHTCLCTICVWLLCHACKGALRHLLCRICCCHAGAHSCCQRTGAASAAAAAADAATA